MDIKTVGETVTENNRLKQLVRNMAKAYLVEMSEKELEQFCISEVGFTQEEYDEYIK